jgi:2-iminobutanoate/2-iminopropanoate deaminase
VSSMQVIHTEDAPSHNGPVPQAVEVDGWIYVSSLFGGEPATKRLPEDASEEADLLFRNLAAILRAAGAELTDVVRVGIFMRDLQGDRPAFNEAWKQHFGDHRPARSAIEASDFGRPGENARYMVEAVAHRG